MTTDYEAIKAGAKEAVAEWLETHPDRIKAGVRTAVLDWIELTAQGSCAIDSGAERAIAEWVKAHEPELLRAFTEAMAKRRSS
ncbi:hypothetical protein [Streptomyces sp. HUAS TT20]|uniref:hypothetical protein n=1 Tax=Streptomyces sp. HUAS TT20 TaxID=3447509 RepID=UPI0021D994EF|nr:hypothetical protein [Streptomyces sp. HUAS 15-9]UXY28576.1 hypothetical protein N8I87_19760 [Streptomyces sp. HUAS 15-9]